MALDGKLAAQFTAWAWARAAAAAALTVRRVNLMKLLHNIIFNRQPHIDKVYLRLSFPCRVLPCP